MKIIVASDIFGVNQALESFMAGLNIEGVCFQLISPYPQSELLFDDEQAAYQLFLQSGGVSAFADKLLELNITSKDVVLGFSAGAASLWKCLADNPKLSCAHMVGFYPSQIRHHLHQAPNCDVSLVFPKHEPHFKLPEMMDRLRQYTQVECIQTPYLHGFMNPQSVHHSAAGATQYSQWLSALLHHIQAKD